MFIWGVTPILFGGGMGVLEANFTRLTKTILISRPELTWRFSLTQTTEFGIETGTENGEIL